MGRVRTIARRTFLVGSVAIAGGVAFGVYLARKTPPNPLQPAEGEATLNPFILINQDGVTIIAPRAEMGQGVHTTLAALVAEELDVAWDDITVLHGPPAQAYYNGALLGAALPYPEYDLTDFQHGVADNLAVMAKIMGLQVTGGSTAMKDAFEKQRHAGASAREALKQAAANRLGLDAGDLRTQNGQIIAPDGTTLAYHAVAEDAAALDAPEVALRPASEWKYVGKSMPRVDMVGKVTGTATFGIDTVADGMVFATLRMNPRLGAGMTSFDAVAARAMEGVIDVIDLGRGIAVVARNTWLAFQAADAVEVEWEDAPYPADSAALMDVIAASFDLKPDSTLRDVGDVDTPVDGTEITARYHVPWLAHATMEPMNATAHFTGDALTIWAGNQAPIIVQQKCAEVCELDQEQVTVHTPFMGGGFGRRGEADFAVYAAQIAKALPDTPVKVTWTREEDMRHDFYRPAAMARFRGVVKDGEALLLEGKIAAPSTTRQSAMRIAGFAPPGADKGHVEGSFDQPYGIPNFRISGHIADLSVPIGFWRSVGNSYNGFFFDSFIDEMAHAAGRDPLEFRLQLIAREDAPSAGCITAVAEMCAWTGQTAGNVGRGVGFTYSFGTPVAQVVEVVDTDGEIRINKVWIACDVGTALDPDIIKAQMMGGAIMGLSAAAGEEISFADGEVQQWNYPDYDPLRMHNAPAVDVRVLETNPHLGGVGEPGTPPAMPALANALFDLTGTRARELPLSKSFNLIA
ncbi:molybdopterin cofactor-binding domain-containing protein [Octadecabacter sp. R77987]|uniref:xanthine dehydrogenase family protein molybdopterin-binding subunit n=1 Tax=Octadecabacter sp. R77987 TaxID=3093874 RepID=UPI0036702792